MEKPKLDYYVWADKVADQLREKNAKKHVLHGMWTPSGYFHIGNSRVELMIPHFVQRSLENIGLKSEQNFIVDDFDDFDKIPEGLHVKKEKFEHYLGKPLREVPSPVEGYDSWADFFRQDITSTMDNFGIQPNIKSSYDSYKKGIYDKAIKIVLDNSQRVVQIWNEIAKGSKQEAQIPVMPLCENCGKSSTTEAVSWDGRELQYSCTSHRKYAKGCGHKCKFKPVV